MREHTVPSTFALPYQRFEQAISSYGNAPKLLVQYPHLRHEAQSGDVRNNTQPCMEAQKRQDFPKSEQFRGETEIATQSNKTAIKLYQWALAITPGAQQNNQRSAMLTHQASEQQHPKKKKKSSVYMPNMHKLCTFPISKHWNATTMLKTCPNRHFSKQK